MPEGLDSSSPSWFPMPKVIVSFGSRHCPHRRGREHGLSSRTQGPCSHPGRLNYYNICSFLLLGKKKAGRDFFRLMPHSIVVGLIPAFERAFSNADILLRSSRLFIPASAFCEMPESLFFSPAFSVLTLTSSS